MYVSTELKKLASRKRKSEKDGDASEMLRSSASIHSLSESFTILSYYSKTFLLGIQV